MWFLAGFIGTAILVPTVNFLLTVLVVLSTSRLRHRRKMLLGAKEHLVFFAILGGGLWIALHYNVQHPLGNDIPSGVLASILIEAWVFAPSWARLSEPGASKAPWLQL
jgi:hypothetical protein